MAKETLLAKLFDGGGSQISKTLSNDLLEVEIQRQHDLQKLHLKIRRLVGPKWVIGSLLFDGVNER